MKSVVRHCAIYTRKSTDERLEMEFNSLDAQREACHAYIVSQKAEGWSATKKTYDDGGFSGGSMERPALAQLLADIRAKKVNIVVVYKIDRLTRSLMDFAKLVEIFDQYGVTFVSVTQSFNTTTSMGRLTLNVLLSFAQFEREVAGERIRDKIAASKKKGMFMGGVPPIGYRVENRQLLVDKKSARITQHIFERYLVLGSTVDVAKELEQQGIRSPTRVSESGKHYGDAIFTRGAVHQILTNPVYIGKVRHRGVLYEGQHEGIIPVDLWDRVQENLQNWAASPRGTTKVQDENLLRKILFDADGAPYRPTFTNKGGKRYRYYSCINPDSVVPKIPAHEIETLVEKPIRQRLSSIKDAVNLLHLEEDQDYEILTQVLKCHSCIPVRDILKSVVRKVTVDASRVIICLNIAALRQLVGSHTKITMPDGEFDSAHEIVVPYSRAHAAKGAVVIRPDNGKKDLLDMPPQQLKNFVRGIIWRDEHFNGLSIREISVREGLNETYVGRLIHDSFSALQN